MTKHVGLLLAILSGYMPVLSQEDYVQSPTLGIQFFFNDFKTPWYIRNTSLRETFKQKQFARLKDMSPGLAINYIYGLSKHYDFSATLTGAFLDYLNRDNSSYGKDALLLEGDVSIRGKLLTEKSWISPYLQIGTGISKYTGYWGAFIPAGMGIQFNLFGEAYLLINAQYRMAVTNTVSNHLLFGIGLAGNIGRRRGANKSSLPED